MSAIGTPHEFEPEDVDALNYFDFEGEMPDTDRDGKEAVDAWHHTNLDILAEEYGIEVEDLKRMITNDYSDDAYNIAERRLNLAGLDTYQSDTRFEVFKPIVKVRN